MKTQYTIGQFAKIVCKSATTLRNWDKQGVLVANRTLTGQRYYTNEHLIKCGIDPHVVKEVV